MKSRHGRSLKSQLLGENRESSLSGKMHKADWPRYRDCPDDVAGFSEKN